MVPAGKRPRLEEWIRLSDGFIRTEVNVICPVIKAEYSIRVLYILQEDLLTKAIKRAGESIGLTFENIQFLPESTSRGTERTLFIKFKNLLPNDEKLYEFKKSLEAHLKHENTTLQDIIVDRVQDTTQTIPQPLISEADLEMHRLELFYKILSKYQPDTDEMDAVSYIRDSIKDTINEYKEKRTKIAILSQNAKGKSFLLNSLFRLTIDNEEEYKNNNKELKLPKDITGDPTIEELGETINQLPDVVKEVLKTHQNPKEKIKTLIEPMYFDSRPPSTPEKGESKKLFLNLPNYFKDGGRIVAEPYILPQKTRQSSNESTTKCIIHVRYGTVYQIKVNYFTSEDLKQQLFELVPLSRNSRDNVDNRTKDETHECLLTRFALLTDTDISEINTNVLQKFRTYNDIVLSEEVKKFAGKTELYIGSGKDATEDRLILKAILRGLTSPQNSDVEKEEWKRKVAAVKEIVVYVPSKFLYGGKEILEMPGTDHSDVLALHFINEALKMADAAIVMSDFSFNIAEKEVKDILNNSKFIQKWKESPELFPLMLLAYPEKDEQFQVKIGEIEKIEEIKTLEVKKRSTELKQLCELIGMSLSNEMEAAVFTSYIMPVLHTSINAQEGTPHKVIQEHACYLECTGIEKMMIHLDQFIASTRKMDFQQLQERLTTKATKGLVAEYARVLIKMYDNRELKEIRQNTLFSKFTELILNLSKNLKQVYTLEGQVAITLADMEKEALQKWDLNQEDITSIVVFNPSYKGNRANRKVKISDIILGNIEGLTSEIFKFLTEEIDKLLGKFKEDVYKLFAEELNNVLDLNECKNIDTSTFVKQSIEDVLSVAQEWYMGKKKKPINKPMVGKCLEESKKAILKKYILTPAYGQSDLNLAKQLARKSITKAVNAFKCEMMNHLFDLHTTRWTSFLSHLKGRTGIPKPWQVLRSKLKSFENTSTQQQNSEELAAVLELIRDKYPK